jgi:hypothetical protein
MQDTLQLFILHGGWLNQRQCGLTYSRQPGAQTTAGSMKSDAIFDCWALKKMSFMRRHFFWEKEENTSECSTSGVIGII